MRTAAAAAETGGVDIKIPPYATYDPVRLHPTRTALVVVDMNGRHRARFEGARS